MSTNVHDGHRQRMRERILDGGMNYFQPHEVLEYLLYSFIPRKDTNVIAHELINKFGSFNGVLNAAPERLAEVSGMTENAALFLSSLPIVFRKYLVNLKNPRTKLRGRGEVRTYMSSLCMGLAEERAFVAAVDVQDGLIACEEISKGSGNSVSLSVRAVVNFAILHNAAGIIVAHNHPSGNPFPSHNDLAFTRELHSTLESVQVRLLDHFIFCHGDYYSFEASGRMADIVKQTTILKEGVWSDD